MTHKEIREQSQRLLLLAGIKLFGTKGDGMLRQFNSLYRLISRL